MGTCIEIVDWGKHYENYRTRELKKMDWVPMPNRHDGDGYTELLNHVNGTAHFGAWCALIEVASRCSSGDTSVPPTYKPRKYRDQAKYNTSEHPFGRGILVRRTGEPHDANSLSRITRIPIPVWDEALKRLVTIGWIRYCEISVLPTDALPMSYRDNTDVLPIEYRMNGTERNGTERGENEVRASEDPSPSSASPTQPQEKDLSTFVDNRIPQEGMPMMLEIMEIHRKATGGADMPRLTDDEMSQLLALFRKHDGPSVVAAYRAHQAAKPGKAFAFFLKDFAEYFARAPKPTPPPPEPCGYCGARGKYHTPSCNRPGNEGGLPLHDPPPPDDFDDDFPEVGGET